jgi:hypothetical protein
MDENTAAHSELHKYIQRDVDEKEGSPRRKALPQPTEPTASGWTHLPKMPPKRKASVATKAPAARRPKAAAADLAEEETKIFEVPGSRQDSAGLGRTDIRLSVGDQSLSGHKVVLAMVSGMWRAQFCSPVAESQSKEELKLEGITFAALTAIVEFAYTGKITLSGPSALVIIQAANLLQVEAVERAAVDFLVGRLDAANVLAAIALGVHLHAGAIGRELRDKSRAWLHKNFELVAAKPSFLQLSAAEVAELVGSDEIFSAMMDWVKKNEVERKAELVRLLPPDRFPRMANPVVLRTDEGVGGDGSDALRKDDRGPGAPAVVFPGREQFYLSFPDEPLTKRFGGSRAPPPFQIVRTKGQFEVLVCPAVHELAATVLARLVEELEGVFPVDWTNMLAKEVKSQDVSIMIIRSNTEHTVSGEFDAQCSTQFISASVYTMTDDSVAISMIGTRESHRNCGICRVLLCELELLLLTGDRNYLAVQSSPDLVNFWIQKLNFRAGGLYGDKYTCSTWRRVFKDTSWLVRTAEASECMLSVIDEMWLKVEAASVRSSVPSFPPPPQPSGALLSSHSPYRSPRGSRNVI